MENCKGFVVTGIETNAEGEQNFFILETLFDDEEQAYNAILDSMSEDMEEYSEITNPENVVYNEEEMYVYIDGTEIHTSYAINALY